jgi:hypothetical protein
MSIRTGSVVTVLLMLAGTASAADTAAGQPASSARAGAGAGLGSSWADAAKMPDLFTGTWMTFTGMVESDEKLNVPYTPAAQKYVDGYRYKRDIPYAEDGCKTPGLPIAMRPSPIQFSYAPGLIAIYMQSVGHTRFIRMNQPVGKTSPKYYGNSVGHWEGDTLVVESTDFLPEITFQYGIGKGLPRENTLGTANLAPIGGVGGARTGGAPPGGAARGGGPASAPEGLGGGGGVAALSKAIMGPHGDNMRVVERMRLIDPQTLEISTTLYDDTVWTKPFVGAPRNFRRVVKGVSEIGPFNGQATEWVCTVSVTSFDPDTNTYNDKSPEEMVKYLDKLGR